LASDSQFDLRPATPADRDSIIALIDRVYREYGDRICLDDADADLLDISASYREFGGEFVVLANDDEVVGTHAVRETEQPGVCTFRRLYLESDLRGGDWGARLMEWAVEWSKTRGFERVEFWSDTRFERAHRFFQRLGFTQSGSVRHLDDGWEPYSEFFFFRDLSS
jgi:putative acetyltransferase